MNEQSSPLTRVKPDYSIISGIVFFFLIIALLWWPLASFRAWAKILLSSIALIASLILGCESISLFTGLVTLTVAVVLIWWQLGGLSAWGKLGLSLGAFALAGVVSLLTYWLEERFHHEGISGLLPNAIKPRWMHSDDDIREKAVASLNNQAILGQIARHDTSRKVRLAAVLNIDSQQLLAEIAIRDTTGDTGEAAVQRINDEALLLKVALECAEEDAGDNAVLKIRNQTQLEEISMSAKCESVRRSAIRKIRDEDVLRRIAGLTQGAVRLEAAETLGDPDLIADIALHDPSQATRWNAVNSRKLAEPVLARIAATDRDPYMRELAAAQIKDEDLWVEARRRSAENPICPRASQIFSWCFGSAQDADHYFEGLEQRARTGGVAARVYCPLKVGAPSELSSLGVVSALLWWDRNTGTRHIWPTSC